MKRLFLLCSFVHLGSLSPFYNLVANDIEGSKVTKDQQQIFKSLDSFFGQRLKSLGLGLGKITSEIKILNLNFSHAFEYLFKNYFDTIDMCCHVSIADPISSNYLELLSAPIKSWCQIASLCLSNPKCLSFFFQPLTFTYWGLCNINSHSLCSGGVLPVWWQGDLGGKCGKSVRIHGWPLQVLDMFL